MTTPLRAIPQEVSEAPHSPSCRWKTLYSNPTATRPTRPSPPSLATTARTFPMTSTGKNGAGEPKSSPTITARHRRASPRSHESLSHDNTASNLSFIVLSPSMG